MAEEKVFTEEQNATFNVLYQIDVSNYTEKKKSGKTELTYLSWAWAWAEVKKRFPDANYTIQRFGENKMPFQHDENLGYMVWTTVSINDQKHEMWLPVMDGANKAMKSKPYEYQVIKWTNGKRDGFTNKRVEQATMFDINTAIMRCLVKNLAMFGLGLYIYAGEDLPEMPSIKEEQAKELKGLFAEIAKMTKKSTSTIEAQMLSRFEYAGNVEDMKETLFHKVKENALSGIEQMKQAAENTQKA